MVVQGSMHLLTIFSCVAQGSTLWNICVTNDNGYVPLIINTSRFFPHSRLITGYVSMTGITCGAATTYPSGAREFNPSFQWCSCYSIFSFMCMFFVLFVPFLLAIVLSVLLRYTDSDYTFGIFKLIVFNLYHSISNGGLMVRIYICFVTSLSVSLHNLLDFYNLFCLCCIVMSRRTVTH